MLNSSACPSPLAAKRQRCCIVFAFLMCMASAATLIAPAAAAPSAAMAFISTNPDYTIFYTAINKLSSDEIAFLYAPNAGVIGGLDVSTNMRHPRGGLDPQGDVEGPYRGAEVGSVTVVQERGEEDALPGRTIITIHFDMCC